MYCTTGYGGGDDVDETIKSYATVRSGRGYNYAGSGAGGGVKGGGGEGREDDDYAAAISP